MKKGVIITIIAVVIIALILYYPPTFNKGSTAEPTNNIQEQQTTVQEPTNKTVATYKLTFISSWSEETHPQDFPSNPHWSGLIGASHNDEITYWKVGGIASEGIEEVAETGSKSKFIPEIEEAIQRGNTNQIISGAGINPSPGEVSILFNMSKTHPQITIISMIAPSPDWFVGVANLELFENGEWIANKEIELFVYDAGTDDGEEYTASNKDTNPKAPIQEVSYEGLQKSSVGQFIFEKI